MDALIYALYAIAIPLWWWLFREARKAEREDALKRAVDLAKAASAALAREREDQQQ